MPPVKALTRYDTWDQDRTPQEWLARCNARPDQCHAISPVFDKGEYGWKPVRVVDYDEVQKKFKVMVGDTDASKMVTRLSLLFYEEDPEAFRERVNLCKERQANVEAELRFTNMVDSVSPEAVS
jgi:dynein heavy chain